MQVSPLPDKSIQFQSGDRYLKVTSPSLNLSTFFIGGGALECNPRLGEIMDKSLQPSGLFGGIKTMTSQEFRGALGESHPQSCQRVVEARLIQPQCVQVVYDDKSSAFLAMSGPQIYRLVQRIYENKGFFLCQDREWIGFPKEVRFSDLRGDKIGQLKIWSSDGDAPVEANRRERVHKVEVEYLGGEGDERVYLLRYFSKSDLVNGGRPVSAVQVATLAEIGDRLKKPGLVSPPGQRIDLEVRPDEVLWNLPPSDDFLPSTLRLAGVYNLESREAELTPRSEVTFVENGLNFKIEIRRSGRGVVVREQLSKDEFLALSKNSHLLKFYKRAETGCVPISWDQFQAAWGMKDLECRIIRQVKVVGLVDVDTIEFEEVDQRGVATPLRLQLADFYRLSRNFSQVRLHIRDLYSPIWEGDQARWICFDKEMKLVDQTGKTVAVHNLWSRVEAIYQERIWELDAIESLSPEDNRIVVRQGEVKHSLNLSCDALFRRLSALRDGKSVMFRASIQLQERQMPISLRLASGKMERGRVTQMLAALKPHISPAIAQLPVDAFASRPFPVERVVVTETSQRVYQLECIASGKAFDGSDVMITAVLTGDYYEIRQAVRKGSAQKRMLLSTQLPTKDKVYVEIVDSTVWEWPEGSSLAKGFTNLGRPIDLRPPQTKVAPPVVSLPKAIMEEQPEIKEEFSLEYSLGDLDINDSSEISSGSDDNELNNLSGSEFSFDLLSNIVMNEVHDTTTIVEEKPKNDDEEFQLEEISIVPNSSNSEVIVDNKELEEILSSSSEFTSEITTKDLHLVTDQPSPVTTHGATPTGTGLIQDLLDELSAGLTAGQPFDTAGATDTSKEPVKADLPPPPKENVTTSRRSKSRYYVTGAVITGAFASVGLWKGGALLRKTMDWVKVRWENMVQRP